MADYLDPSMALAANPYLMPQTDEERRAARWGMLSNTLLGLGAGLSQAGANGQNWMAGVAPGLLMGSSMTARDQQMAQTHRERLGQMATMAEYRRAQEETMREKMKMAADADKRKAALGGQIASLLGSDVPGFSVPTGGPLMGPPTMQAGGGVNPNNIGNVRPVGATTGFQQPASFDDGVALTVGNVRSYPGAYNGGQPMPFWDPSINVELARSGFMKEKAKQPLTPAEQVEVAKARRTVAGNWAPYGDGANDPPQWARNVATIGGLPVDQPLDFSNPQIAAQFAMGVHGAEKGAAAVRPIDAYMPGVQAGGPGVVRTGGPQVAQGDSIPGTAGVPQSAIASLPREVRAAIGLMAQQDPEKALKMAVDAIQNQKKDDAFYTMPPDEAKAALGPAYNERQVYQRNKVTGRIETVGQANKDDSWIPLGVDDAKMFLGPAYDATKAYQRNKSTGEIKPVGGSLVNINNQSESEFTKHLAAQDAKRIGEIQDNTKIVLDTASKVRMATDLLSRTYTGTGADYANEWFKTLGSLGVTSYSDKANAAQAATALINELTPKMRAPGSGATSDFEMRSFAAALPSMLALPGGNEMVAKMWERIADRQVAVQQLAEKHALESKGLTGTKFAEDVKALGPLFSKEELAQMKELSSGGKPAGDRPPLQTFGGPTQGQSSMPGSRPPLSSFGGSR